MSAELDEVYNQHLIDKVIEREGGYVDHPDDKGGPTKYGITLKTARSYYEHRDMNKETLKDLRVRHATEIYKDGYLVGPKINLLKNRMVRAITFDTAVLYGPARAIGFLQLEVGVEADGIIGPITLGAVNNFRYAMVLLNSIIVRRIRYSVHRVVEDPTQLDFLEGWIVRALSFHALNF